MNKRKVQITNLTGLLSPKTVNAMPENYKAIIRNLTAANEIDAKTAHTEAKNFVRIIRLAVWEGTGQTSPDGQLIDSIVRQLPISKFN